MQKQEKRRELRLKRFWRSPKTTSSDDSTGYESPTRTKAASAGGGSDAQRFNHLHYTSLSQGSGTSSSAGGGATGSGMGAAVASGSSKPSCSLPLLQVWPSQPLLRQEGFVQLRRNSGPEGQRDSPRGEADGQSFVFPAIVETSVCSPVAGEPSSSLGSTNLSLNARRSNNHLSLSTDRRSSLYCDTLHAGDSGIDSVQASPSPNAFIAPPGVHGLPLGQTGGGSCHVSPTSTPTQGSPNLSLGRRGMRNSICVVPSGATGRRKSSALLHPDHARLFALRMKHAAALERAQTSPDQTSIEDANEFHDNGLATNLRLCSASSSTTSSLTSVAAVSLGGAVGGCGGAGGSSGGGGTGGGSSSGSAYAVGAAGVQQRVSDPWLQPQSDRERDSRHDGRRRSSTMTARYSLFDALDLEYVLLRAAARGSVGPYSLSESIHKLTFTQSLAFPALARGLATKRRRSATHTSSRPLNPHESGLNTCAKVVTAVVLVALSFMVFLIVYKFVRT
ncbi:secreted protein C isoform X1 [Drosophila ananassae]|uniref:secreted protein C isoform X1 n=1 Tax=Drosophila ananassae TaxID=7217 RepID=UPI001CFF7539|nr:secreted protein C isoform X1 [Drosophila ananassae]